MRVLFTVVPSTSHLFPLVPLAWALQAAGHEVRVAGHPDFAGTIIDAGLTPVPVGEEDSFSSVVSADDDLYRRIVDAVTPDFAEGDLRRPLSKYVMGAFFLYYPAEPPAAGSRSTVDDLVAFARGWRPDLIIWDPMFFAAPVAARACGAAHARMLWAVDDVAWTRARLVERSGRTGEDLMMERMRPTLRRFDTEFDEELLVGQWTIEPVPHRKRLPLDLRYVPVQAVPYNGSAAVPEWLWTPPRRPRVCLSLGMSIRKFFPDASTVPVADLFQIAADLDIELVATLDDAQLAEVDNVPENVRVIDFLPLNLLLPTCSAIIHHGGSGTFNAAAAHLVPQLICREDGPYFDDVSRYVDERGAGLVVDNRRFSVDEVKKQLVRILTEPSFQEGAAGMYADMLATPSPAELVPALERLTELHRSRR